MLISLGGPSSAECWAGESLAVVGPPTLQSTKHKQKNFHTHSTHTQRAAATLPRAALPSLSMGRAAVPKIMALPLPIAMLRRRAIGVALAVVGLLVGGFWSLRSINRQRGRLGLRWPPFYGYKQQSNRGRLRRWKGFGEGARPGRNVWG